MRTPKQPATPSFRAQKRVDDTLRAMLRQSLQYTTGVDPTAAELDEAVRREFGQLSAALRTGNFSESLLPPISPATTPVRADDVAVALRYAQAHGVSSILEAVRTYVTDHGVACRAPRLPDCVEEFLVLKRAEGRAPSTLCGYTSKLRRFATEFSTRRPAELPPAELGQFLRRAEHPKTRLDWWNTLQTFYKWCVGVKYIAENPVPRVMMRPRSTAGAGLVLTPPEARTILTAVRDTDQLAFWCLGLFAGLRSTELRRLSREPDPWSIVRLESRVIDLPDHITKSGPRLVPISATLDAWLKLCRERECPFFPPNHFLKLRTLRELVLSPRTRVLEAAHRARGATYRGPIWGYNIARRSHISYRLAAGAIYSAVAREVGNTEAIIRSNYEHRVPGADAHAFLALTPLVCDAP